MIVLAGDFGAPGNHDSSISGEDTNAEATRMRLVGECAFVIRVPGMTSRSAMPLRQATERRLAGLLATTCGLRPHRNPCIRVRRFTKLPTSHRKFVWTPRRRIRFLVSQQRKTPQHRLDPVRRGTVPVLPHLENALLLPNNENRSPRHLSKFLTPVRSYSHWEAQQQFDRY